MSKIYLLESKTLKILGEASNYEAVYDLMTSDPFDELDTLVSPNPPLASKIIWESDKLARSTKAETDRKLTNKI